MAQQCLPGFLNQHRSALTRDFAQITASETERIADGIAAPFTSPWSTNVGAHNPLCNRYYNVLPWESTRVRLNASPHDYINASLIRLPNSRHYIASQGPTRSTTCHFWAMAFQQAQLQQSDTVVIVMVTPLVERGVRKCDKYWPGPENPLLDLLSEASKDSLALPLGLTVRFCGSDHYADGAIVHSKLELVLGATTKQVHHFHYTQWADARVPPSLGTLLTLSRVMREAQAGSSLVPIVHCSAGVGRTGTFIVLDYLLHDPAQFVKIADDLQMDPLNLTVSNLRGARMLMVQTEHQYLWLYEAAIKVYRMGLEPNSQL